MLGQGKPIVSSQRDSKDCALNIRGWKARSLVKLLEASWNVALHEKSACYLRTLLRREKRRSKNAGFQGRAQWAFNPLGFPKKDNICYFEVTGSSPHSPIQSSCEGLCLERNSIFHTPNQIPQKFGTVAKSPAWSPISSLMPKQLFELHTVPCEFCSQHFHAVIYNV